MEKKLSLLAILLQAFYWLFITTPALASVVFLIFHTQALSSTAFMQAMEFNGIYEVVLILNFYAFYLVLFPRYIETQRLRPFLFSGLLVTLISIGLLAILVKVMPFPFAVIKTFGVQLANISIPTILNPLYACGIVGIISWLRERHERQKMQKFNLETELALLKAQINPHFLFNTLNNIDILIEKDADAASTYLKKLSGILRFMLYESPAEKIRLTQEIDYIKEYIELQMIRTSNANFVKFDVKGDTDNLYIAPMLFIPFIENAFKHCTDKKINNAIEIDVTIKDGEINFMCSNALDASAQLTQPKSGLGLDLIRNRLELLYKENYQLKIDKTNERFTVTLTVKLHDN